jgi:hypothetical protein
MNEHRRARHLHPQLLPEQGPVFGLIKATSASSPSSSLTPAPRPERRKGCGGGGGGGETNRTTIWERRERAMMKTQSDDGSRGVAWESAWRRARTASTGATAWRRRHAKDAGDVSEGEGKRRSSDDCAYCRGVLEEPGMLTTPVGKFGHQWTRFEPLATVVRQSCG